MLAAVLRRRLPFVAYAMTLTLLVVARDVGGISMPKFLFVALAGIFSVLGDYRHLLCVILFTLPFFFGLPGKYIMALWLPMVLYHQWRGRSQNGWAVAFVLVVALWELALTALGQAPFQGAEYFGLISTLALFALVVGERRSMDYSEPVLAFCLGSCLVLAVMFKTYSLEVATLDNESMRMGNPALVAEREGMALKANANDIALFSAATIALTLVLYSLKRINAIWALVLVSVAFLSGMYSVSRTWVLSLVLTLTLYVAFQHRGGWRVWGLMTLALSGGVAYGLTHPEMVDAFIGRFTDDTVSTGGNRTVLFKAYSDYLLDHPIRFLFGTSALGYKEVTGIYYSTHNAFQQIWLSYGFFGFLLFVCVFVQRLFALWPKGRWIAVLPMLVVVFFLQSLQVLNPHDGLYPLLAAFLLMKTAKGHQTKNVLCP